MDNEGELLAAYRSYLHGKYGDKITKSDPRPGERCDNYVSRMREIYPERAQVAFLDAYEHYAMLLTATQLCVAHYPQLLPNGRVRRIFPLSLNENLLTSANNDAILLHLLPTEAAYIMGKFNGATYELAHGATRMSREEQALREEELRSRNKLGLLMLRVLGRSDDRIDQMVHEKSKQPSGGRSASLLRASEGYHSLAGMLPQGISYNDLIGYSGRFEAIFEPLDIYPNIGRNIRERVSASYSSEVSRDK